MSKAKINPLITASVMSAVYLAGMSNVATAVVSDDITSSAGLNAAAVYNSTPNSYVPAPNEQGHRRYIIRFNEPAVARYNGAGSFAPIPRKADGKIDSQSAAVQSYVAHLRTGQQNFLSQLNSVFSRSVKQNFSFAYAVNGVVVELNAQEAAQVKSMPSVAHVELDLEYDLNTDVGPQVIGADNVWLGNAPSSGSAFGEGVVIGILDTGANFDHPSFADVGDDAYDHTNPLGTGNYLGVCDPSNTDQFDASYTCNDKLIGGFDFVNDITPGSGFDLPGPEDEQGHGSHVAATAGGNLVNTAEISGISNITVSGVARHANIVAFDTCYDPQGQPGGCFGSSAVASIDQILADGVVDVVNYSVSGGTQPWTDTVSLAFLSATDSGVFVSTSAGNSGPGPGTLGHVEPWTASIGASTHNRYFDNLIMSITGPVPEPTLENLDYNLSTGLPPVPTINAGIQYAGDVDPANFEGCNPFPGGSLTGSVVLISRGSCSFADKVNNSSAAGAIAAVIHNNAAGIVIMGGLEGTTIPSVSIQQADGTAMAAYITANPGATIEINQPTYETDGQSDVMAGFSSRGPSAFEYNKPDVAAPGVSILAAEDDQDIGTGTAAEWSLKSGTSMAAPHNAGAAALLKELHPTWSAPEIKSALMMTSVTAGVTKEDGTTPADPFDRGAGRIQVDAASSTGLVMDETAFRFLLADPANGGDPKTLNVPSLTDYNCAGTCSFQRDFTSVASVPVTYDASITGVTGTVNPASFTVNPGQTVTLDIDIDGNALPPAVASFGELVIIPQLTSTTPFSINPSIAIPDDGYDGSLVSMACGTISVSGVTAGSVQASVDVGIDHTWVGDLTIKLENPDLDVLGLMSRTGFAEAADDGAGCCGPGTDLVSTSPLTFIDGAALTAEDAGNNYQACIDNGDCDFAPFPDTVAQPPSTLADMVGGTINGDWRVCAGDSVGADTGTLETATLNILEPLGITVSDMHLPIVVIAPAVPEITVTPSSLAGSVPTNGTSDLTLNIENDASATTTLNWNFDPNASSGLPGAVIFEQANLGALNGILSTDIVALGGGVFSSENFTLGSDVTVDNFVFDGFSNAPDLSAEISEFNILIYPDNAGVPAGHPEDGGGTEIFSVTIPVGNPNLTIGGAFGGEFSVNVAGFNGSGVDLTAGTYWVTGFPTFTGSDFGFLWNWFSGVPSDAVLPHLIDPQDLLAGGFTDWTDTVTVTGNTDYSALSFSLTGPPVSCNTPWISTSTSSGALAVGANEDVTVTLDATGLLPGTYEGALCIASDDPDEPLTVVPVTMTVDDIIFADNFDNPPPPAP